MKANSEETVVLDLGGMTCSSCAVRIEKGLSKQPGVIKAEVNFATEQARVHFDSMQVKPEDLLRAVENEGYEARINSVVPSIFPETGPVARPKPSTISLDITGMHCASCVGNVEEALQKVPGVLAARVNLASEKASVDIDPARASIPEMLKSVEEAGYGASLSAPSRSRASRQESLERERRQQAERARLHRDLMIALVFGFPVALISMTMVQFPYVHQVLFVLTLPVWAYAGRRFHLNALRLARRFSANMDTLVSVGTTAAFIWSVAAMLTGRRDQIYFDSAAVIIALILLGKVFETRAKRRASDAIRALMDLQPPVARVERDGAVLEVPLEEVRVGDTLVIRPGDRIPVDGVVVEGTTGVVESMLTGESIPVEKIPGSKVTGGTLNGTGAIRYRATRVGEDTTLAEIVRVVESAQGSKAPIQRLADRVAGVFVPIVMGIALVTFIAHWLIQHNPSLAVIDAVAVLVIACPCAMGLATPTAIMVGTGKGAEMGVLIRGGDSLEKVRHLSTVIFDKTGTITRGIPEVTDIVPAPGWDERRLLALTAAVEGASEHPLADAIVRAARERNVTPEQIKFAGFQYTPGRGVSAKIDGETVLVGNRRLFEEEGINLEGLEKGIASLEADGKTVVLIARGNRLAGWVGIQDPPKPEAKAVVETLHRMGLKVAMLTGDARRTAEAVARLAGIEEVIAEALPQQKLEAIESRQRQGSVVAMVGDGVNDAPALAKADLGIALGSGSAVALDTADIALLGDDLRGVVRAIELSRLTVKTIKQNLFWAFFYNIVGIPIAALGWLNPMIAAAAMAFSSVFVVSNSLRLRKLLPDARG
ncbi:MAG TPA: heavy metal translocating P-type ATPase [Terriglobia bacterium]|nr:heavy metal translocating P-type ATPase [Terriglobia bacterium]